MSAATPIKMIKRISVRRPTIEKMLATMREFGSNGWELLVLWIGEIDSTGESARVVQAFVPKQKAITSEDGVGYFVSGETLFELNKALADTGLRLIAQVHSHPHMAYHSEADDRYAIVTAEGGYSLVVPEFGDASIDPSDWAVYRLHGRDWLELEEKEVRDIFKVSNE